MIAHNDKPSNGYEPNQKKIRQPPPKFSSRRTTDLDDDEPADVSGPTSTGQAADGDGHEYDTNEYGEDEYEHDGSKAAATLDADEADADEADADEADDDEPDDDEPDDDLDASSNVFSAKRRFDLAVRAMNKHCKPTGYKERVDVAIKRAQEACCIAIAFDLDESSMTDALDGYMSLYPLPNVEDDGSPSSMVFWDIGGWLADAENRVIRGAALLPTDFKISMGASDRNGNRTVKASLGDATYTDHIDPRKDPVRSRFAAAVCESLGLRWAEDQIIELTGNQTGDADITCPFPKYDIGELLQKFPHRRPPVIDGLAREGETLNFISYSKAGKSWLVCQLALSVVFGLSWLGRFPTSRGRVLIVDNELSKDEISHRMGVVANAMGIEVHELAGQIEIWSLRENPRSLDELQADFDAIPPGTFRLIILDAEYKFLPTGISENDNAAIAQFHGRVTSIASRLGALVALVHHISKGSQVGKRLPSWYSNIQPGLRRAMRKLRQRR